MALPKIFRYSLNRKLRGATNGIMRWVTAESNEERLDLHKEQLKKILLVRATFRMGHSILVIPAILLFRKHFPHARIDFVGAPVSAKLFRNLPIDHHFSVTRRYPGSAWDYPLLLRQLRSVGYDIAVDLSCSQSAMASFIVGFSRARFRVGLRGQWDRWFNVRIRRPSERNKYRTMSAFLKALGLEVQEGLPSSLLSDREKQEGRKRIEELAGWGGGRPTVGVFVGARKRWATHDSRVVSLQALSSPQRQLVLALVRAARDQQDEGGNTKAAGPEKPTAQEVDGASHHPPTS